MDTNSEGKPDYAQFRSRGKVGFQTRSLFADVMESFMMQDADKAPYWFERRLTKDSRPCMRDHYITVMDPTGYKTAIKFLGCYEHWETMVERCAWFREALARWDRELHTKQKSRAVDKIREIAEGDSTQALAAAKYLATADYNKLDGRGRPSAAEVKGKLKEQVEMLEADREDLERMGISVLKVKK